MDIYKGNSILLSGRENPIHSSSFVVSQNNLAFGPEESEYFHDF